jgi:hypothetical protein
MGLPIVTIFILDSGHQHLTKLGNPAILRNTFNNFMT